MSFLYYILYKPYNMLSQFRQETEGQVTLADIDFDFPKDVYPVGRLDSDSEGLLLLTNDKSLNFLLLDPKNAHSRTYYVQVDGDISEEAIAKLSQGVTIHINGKSHVTQKAKVEKLPEIPDFPPRNPPVRFRQNIPTSWISITLTEGKNRQVRRMTAAVGFPTLRLVRVQMGKLQLAGLQPGQIRMISRKAIF
jgi:23S rRNA pseudouridine2457 synthase